MGMLHPCIIIVLFLHGLESSPVTQATKDRVNQSGEPETQGNITYNSQEEISTSTLASMLKELNSTVPETNTTQTYITAPTISCNETITNVSLLTNNITAAYNCTPAPILTETYNSTVPTINTTTNLTATTNSTSIQTTTITATPTTI